MEQRYTMISLGVRDLAASTAFYQRLGWTPAKASTDGITFFQCGGVLLGLYGWDALADDANLPPGGSGFRGVAIAHNARTKDDVDALLAEAKAAGADIVRPAEDVFWGGYSGYFRDPDGHLWEIAWNPFLTLADDGAAILPE